MKTQESPPEVLSLRQWVGLILGPIVVCIVFMLPARDLTMSMRVAGALTLLMATLWIFESVPLAATALLPLVILPLGGVAKPAEAAASFANDLIFLFIGGFILGNGIERWGLHRRISMKLLLLIGTNPVWILLAIMMLTAFVSLWVSNTATALLMMPLGMSILQLASGSSKNFATALILGIAQACSIGGMGTPIGSTPNLLFAAEMRNTYNVDTSFLQWMAMGLPLVAVYTLAAWALLAFVLFPLRKDTGIFTRESIRAAQKSLGRVQRGEVIAGSIFAITALGWIFREKREFFGIPFGVTAIFPDISDGTIAIAGALAMVLVPVTMKPGRLLVEWKTAARIPWDIILMFGGGLSMAEGMRRSGLDVYLVHAMTGMQNVPHVVVLIALVIFCVVLSEVASNTAAAALLLPLSGTLATSMGEAPVFLMLPVAMATSLGMMLPVATPPNAMALGTGKVSVRAMMHSGFWINIIGAILVVVGSYAIGFRAYR